MESKRYNNSFTSSSMVKEEGRTAYYKLLDSVRDGDAVRIKRGVYATAEQLADTMIDVEAIIPGGVLCLFSAWNVHGLTTSLPQAYHCGRANWSSWRSRYWPGATGRNSRPGCGR